MGTDFERSLSKRPSLDLLEYFNVPKRSLDFLNLALESFYLPLFEGHLVLPLDVKSRGVIRGSLKSSASSNELYLDQTLSGLLSLRGHRRVLTPASVQDLFQRAQPPVDRH